MPMDKTQETTQLASEKKRLMTEYAERTQTLLTCEIEEIEEILNRRGEIALAVEALDARINVFCEGDSTLADIVRLRCSRQELEGTAGALFDLFYDSYVTAKQAAETEAQVMERFQRERDALSEKIKESNRGMAAQAARYFSGSHEPAGETRFSSFGKA